MEIPQDRVIVPRGSGFSSSNIQTFSCSSIKALMSSNTEKDLNRFKDLFCSYKNIFVVKDLINIFLNFD